jgi:hypothetical protein
MCKCPCTKIRESASFWDRLLFFWAHNPKVGHRFQARRRKELLQRLEIGPLWFSGEKLTTCIDWLEDLTG